MSGKKKSKSFVTFAQILRYLYMFKARTDGTRSRIDV